VVSAANRWFMITVSHRAGLHSEACDADDCWSHDWAKQWRKSRDIRFSAEVLPKCNARFFYPLKKKAPPAEDEAHHPPRPDRKLNARNSP
jgi:hypothetical protein